MSFELSPYETSSPPTRVYQPSELLDEILLASVVGVGPNIAQSLLQTFGSAGRFARLYPICSPFRMLERIWRN